MKISGFTFVKNATKLFFPIKESIESVLPIVDEFVVALGDNDSDDKTREEILSLNSPKIKIIDTVWDTKTYSKNTEYARQTDIAKDACTGDWLFYLQSDEVIHEKFHQEIVEKCQRYVDDPNVEGFIFKYKHFWGDFNHYHVAHNWYPKEIRLIRNDKNIHSWRDAQSFRYYDHFTTCTEDYLRKEGTRKLKVKQLKAEVYHYGWVRPPHLMTTKSRKMDESYHGKEAADQKNRLLPDEYDYGPLGPIPVFKETHPKVMENWIQKFNWEDKLNYSHKKLPNRPKHTHERFKYRLLTFIEQTFLGGEHMGGFKNYQLLKD
jgi:hypothetical protein